VSRWPAYPAYKESGVEWLGEIPAHWETRSLKYVSSVDYSNVDKHKKEGELPVHLCNYVDVYYNDYITDSLDFMKATASPDEIRKYSLQAGDIIITKDSETWNDIAVPAYVPSELENVLCGYHLALIHPKKQEMDSEYLFRSFSARGISHQFRQAATGITRYGLGKHWLENALFLVPPLSEQRAIAAYLDRETARIDSLADRVRTALDRLVEYRIALISAAVTGKIDVRGKVQRTSQGGVES
jgi:type I restriction enzyme S subunit